MLEQIYTSTKLIDNSYLVNYWNTYSKVFVYINDLDAMILVMNRRIFKIFRDGTDCYLGYVANSDWSFVIPIDRGRIAWARYETPTYYFYMSDEVSFIPHEMEPVFPDYNIPPTPGGTPIYLDLNKQLVLTYYSTGRVTCYNPETNVAMWSFNLETKYTPYNNRLTVNYVDTDYVMLTGFSSNSYNKSFGILVNINTGAVVNTVEYPGEYSGSDMTLQVYDYNHGIFITIGTDKVVRVYANDYYPYSFGSIIPEHYGLFTYVGQDIKVQLTSIGGFPCSDRLVTWYLPTGLGSLEKAVSLTDAAGYAWHYYYGPLTAGGLETITVGWG